MSNRNIDKNNILYDILHDTLPPKDKEAILINLFGYEIDNKGNIYNSDNFPFPTQIIAKLDTLKDIFNHHAEMMKKEGRQDFKENVKTLFI